MSLFLVGNFDVDTVEKYFSQKKLGDLEEMVVRKEKLTLQAVKETDSLRMEVSSPKLAVGIRGAGEVAEEDCYRYNVLLKLLFTMMFG